MDKVVWKYELPELDSIRGSQFKFGFDIPIGARVIHVAYQGQRAYMWAEVDPEHSTEHRKFFSVGTGHGTVPEFSKHLGTLMEKTTGMVWHIYQE